MSWAQEKNATGPASPGALNFTQPLLTNPQAEKANSYINNVTVAVKAGDNKSAAILCEKGDLLITGGYDVHFKGPHNATNIFIYANHPTGVMTRIPDETGKTIASLQEGWEAGLLNNGNEDVKVTAQVLCARGS